MNRTSKRGFTLVELLVVISIIAVLAALVALFTRSAKGSARATHALNNIRQLGMASVHLYSQDHNGAINGLGAFIHPGTGGQKQNIPWRTAYLISSRQVGWKDVETTIGGFKDPTIPPNLSWSPYFPLAINLEFNMARDPSGNWMPPGPTTGRRLAQYDRPGSLIYAVGGHDRVTPAMADDPAYRDMPAKIRSGPYFSHNGKTPAVFLDGHAEMMTFPMKRELFEANP